MQEMSGIDATKILRKTIPEHKQPIIIALTADMMEKTKEKCMQAGMQAVLTKPFTMQQLNQILSKWEYQSA
jgi:CheY-like chemotaxis protein